MKPRDWKTWLLVAAVVIVGALFIYRYVLAPAAS